MLAELDSMSRREEYSFFHLRSFRESCLGNINYN